MTMLISSALQTAICHTAFIYAQDRRTSFVHKGVLQLSARARRWRRGENSPPGGLLCRSKVASHHLRVGEFIYGIKAGLTMSDGKVAAEESELYMGFDFGTSGARVMVIDGEGEICADGKQLYPVGCSRNRVGQHVEGYIVHPDRRCTGSSEVSSSRNIS